MTATPVATVAPTPAPMTPPRRGAAKPSSWPQHVPGTGHALTGSVPSMTSTSYVTWEPQGSAGQQVASMSPATFFTLFAELLRTNPPHANDNDILYRMQRIGLAGPQPFSYDRLDPVVRQALEDARTVAGRRIADTVTRLGTPLNGWNTVLSGIGTYGTDYIRRAAIAYA